MLKLSPHPQEPFELGLLNTNSDFKSSSSKSISEPIRYITALLSIITSTPNKI